MGHIPGLSGIRQIPFIEHPMTADAGLRIIKRRARGAGLPKEIGSHTFHANGITAFLAKGGDLATTSKMAGHESARTTNLYDRTQDELGLDEVERIII